MRQSRRHVHFAPKIVSMRAIPLDANADYANSQPGIVPLCE